MSGSHSLDNLFFQQDYTLRDVENYAIEQDLGGCDLALEYITPSGEQSGIEFRNTSWFGIVHNGQGHLESSNVTEIGVVNFAYIIDVRQPEVRRRHIFLLTRDGAERRYVYPYPLGVQYSQIAPFDKASYRYILCRRGPEGDDNSEFFLIHNEKYVSEGSDVSNPASADEQQDEDSSSEDSE